MTKHPTTSVHTPLRALAALVCAGGLAATLAGCGPMQAQNPPGDYTPVNAVEQAPEQSLMLKGADVVAYFTEGAWRQGSAAHRSQYQGVDFWFANAGHKAQFDREPQRWLPQYGGYCANGIAYAIPWGGNADTWKMIDGKLYIFGGALSKQGFELDEKANLALADKYWAEEVKGSNSFAQRYKRVVWRVPHYKSNKEIAEAVAAAKDSRK